MDENYRKKAKLQLRLGELHNSIKALRKVAPEVDEGIENVVKVVCKIIGENVVTDINIQKLSDVILDKVK